MYAMLMLFCGWIVLLILYINYYTGKFILAQVLSECSVLDGTEDYYSSQNEENEDKNRYPQILPSKLTSTLHSAPQAV